MKIFIDDSGSFNWHDPGRSVFCGVSIPDSNLPEVLDRFARWRRTIIGHSTRELKGCELTDRQLSSFVMKVLPWTDKRTCLTVVGVDTRRTRLDHVLRLREQASLIFAGSSDLMAEHKNPRMKEQYRQMSGWVRSRSPENIMWIIGLVEAVINSLQHTKVRFMDPEDDHEFEDIRIFIDQSFIRKDEHVNFWREWLRNQLGNSSRRPGIIPDTWRGRNHPWIRKYEIHPGLSNLTSVFNRNMGFFRSEKFEGIQIADICAHIVLRHHRGTGGTEAYKRLRPRIVGRQGAEISIIDVDERSLHKDDPRNHVTVFNIEQSKLRADALRGPCGDDHLP